MATPHVGHSFVFDRTQISSVSSCSFAKSSCSCKTLLEARSYVPTKHLVVLAEEQAAGKMCLTNWTPELLGRVQQRSSLHTSAITKTPHACRAAAAIFRTPPQKLWGKRIQLSQNQTSQQSAKSAKICL
jgi:hypothetical protein